MLPFREGGVNIFFSASMSPTDLRIEIITPLGENQKEADEEHNQLLSAIGRGKDQILRSRRSHTKENFTNLEA